MIKLHLPDTDITLIRDGLQMPPCLNQAQHPTPLPFMGTGEPGKTLHL
jgi:hypothetical protein